MKSGGRVVVQLGLFFWLWLGGQVLQCSKGWRRKVRQAEKYYRVPGAGVQGARVCPACGMPLPKNAGICTQCAVGLDWNLVQQLRQKTAAVSMRAEMELQARFTKFFADAIAAGAFTRAEVNSLAREYVESLRREDIGHLFADLASDEEQDEMPWPAGGTRGGAAGGQASGGGFGSPGSGGATGVPLSAPGWDADFVSPMVAVGAAPMTLDVDRLRRSGIGAILNVQEEQEDTVPAAVREAFDWVRIPTRDSFFGGVPTVEWLDRCVEQIHTWVRQGKKVYVHCKMGQGRSPLVCMAYLVKYGGADSRGGMRLSKAISQVVKSHARGDPNVHQLGVLCQYVKEKVIGKEPARATPPWEQSRRQPAPWGGAQPGKEKERKKAAGALEDDEDLTGWLDGPYPVGAVGYDDLDLGDLLAVITSSDDAQLAVETGYPGQRWEYVPDESNDSADEAAYYVFRAQDSPDTICTVWADGNYTAGSPERREQPTRGGNGGDGGAGKRKAAASRSAPMAAASGRGSASKKGKRKNAPRVAGRPGGPNPPQ